MARSQAHIIDSEARRIVAATLPAERFLERDQTERDYGIDMVIEHFAKGEPSGRVLLLQIKGTEGDAPTEGQPSIAYDFQVKSLLRCERFATPILLVWTPVRDRAKRSWFLWLQAYLRIVLNYEKPQWRTQQSVRLHIPSSNLLGDPVNEGKLIHIAGAPARAAEVGQLARLAHETRWSEGDPRTLAPLFEEALGLQAVFGDSTWRWSQDQRRMVEMGLLACRIAMSGVDPTDEQLRAIGFLGTPLPSDGSKRWHLLAVAAQNCARMMSTAVAVYYDDRLRNTAWNAVGDHDF